MTSLRVKSATASPALRRRPKQLRGQRRVEQILHHAEVAFSELGFEQTTTNLIAERADVSIGSLYQFFSSKEAILEAMTDRYLSQTLEALQSRMDTMSSQDLRSIVRDMLELLIKLQERRPFFLQCLTNSRPSPTLNQAMNNLHSAIATHVVGVLKRLGVEGDAELIAVRAQICVYTMGILLPLVVYSRGKARKTAIEEIQNLLMGYLEPLRTKEAA